MCKIVEDIVKVLANTISEEAFSEQEEAYVQETVSPSPSGLSTAPSPQGSTTLSPQSTATSLPQSSTTVSPQSTTTSSPQSTTTSSPQSTATVYQDSGSTWITVKTYNGKR